MIHTDHYNIMGIDRDARQHRIKLPDSPFGFDLNGGAETLRRFAPCR